MTTFQIPQNKLSFSDNLPGTLSNKGVVYLGPIRGDLREALNRSSIPRRLKTEFKDSSQNIKLYIDGRGLNSIIFKANPFVDGTKYFLRTSLEVELNSDPRPDLYLTDRERLWSESFIHDKLLPHNKGKPICVLHAWNPNQRKVVEVEYWDAIVSRWSHRFRFWQVGSENDSAVQGCEYYFLQKNQIVGLRKLFSIISAAQGFIGIDGLHLDIAHAFHIPSLIFVNDFPIQRTQRNDPERRYSLVQKNIQKFDDFFEEISANKR
jgi:hypothetical protein